MNRKHKKIPSPLPSEPSPPSVFNGKKPIPPISQKQKNVNESKQKEFSENNVLSNKRPIQQSKGKQIRPQLKTFEKANEATKSLITDYSLQKMEDDEEETEKHSDHLEDEETEENSEAEEAEEYPEAEEAEEYPEVEEEPRETEVYSEEPRETEVYSEEPRETEVYSEEPRETEVYSEEPQETEAYIGESENEENIMSKKSSSEVSFLDQIQNFKKSKLKKINISENFPDEEDAENSNLLKHRTLNQKQLCFDFWDGNSYPVHKLKYIVLQIPAKAWVTLNFSGISQITDMTFTLMSNLKKTEEVRFNSVRGVVLDGCFMLTDVGLEWMADVFPNLSVLSLVGCTKVTSAGLIALSKKCPNLSSMDISGTNVNYLPKRWISGEGIKMTGCPILFPVASNDVNIKDNIQDNVKNLYKICIIRRERVQVGLLASLNGLQQNSFPDFALYRPEITDGDLTASVIEIHQSLTTFIVTDQSLVIITTELTDQTKIHEEVSSISALILEILAKHANVNILLIGCARNNAADIPIKLIEEEVRKYLKNIGDLIKDTNYSLINIESMSVKAQLEFSCAKRLQENISRVSINSLKINIEKIDEQDLIKNMCTFAKNLYTSEEVIFSKKIYMWAKEFHLNCPHELETGVHSLHKAADVIGSNSGFTEKLTSFGAVFFLTSLGKFCSWTSLHGDVMIANTSWLCKCLNLLLVASSSTVVNNGLDHTIADEVLVWPLQTLEKETKKKNLDWDKMQQLLIEFPYPWLKTLSTLTSLSSLPDTPKMSLKIFTDFNKSNNENGIHLVHTYVLNQIVTPALIQEMIRIVLKLHPAVHVWKTGIIVYDSIVAVMLGTTGYSKVLNLCAYMMSYDEENHSINLMYNTVDKYKNIVESVLSSSGFFWELLRNVSESIQTPPELISGIIHGHAIKVAESDSCHRCGITPMHSSLLTAVEMINQPTFLNEGLVKSSNQNAKISGCVIEYTGPCSTKTAAVIDPFGCRQCSVLLMQGNVKLLKISISSPFADSVCVDLSQQKILVKVHESEQMIDISAFLKDKSLQGETLSFKLKQHKPFEVQVFLGLQLMASLNYLPFHRYELRISSLEFKEDKNTAMITVRGNTFQASTSAVQVGMRLEAVDRKNPHLICVATIAEINPDNDQVLIHFDNWSNNYDYWANLDSDDLHPIGFMAFRGHDLSQKISLRPELQPPSRYTKTFEWLTYLKEENAEPVPFECFTEKQIDGTPPDVIMKVQSEIGFNGFFSGKNLCQFNIVSSHSLENSVSTHCLLMDEKLTSGEVTEILTNRSELFCFLPSSLSVETIRFPELSLVFSKLEQKVHFICPGQHLDVHFVNHPGLSVTAEQFGDLSIWSNALKISIGLLLLQKTMLPSESSSLIAQENILPAKITSQLEMAFRRLMKLYLMHCLFFKETKDMPIEHSFILNMLESTAKSESISQMFGRVQGNLLCNAHKLAYSPSAGILEFPLTKFQELGSYISFLDFENNPLTSIPEKFFSIFCNLVQLQLNGCRIVELPSLKENTCLEVLHIKGNNIQTLPEDMKQLTSLKILDISNNPLEILPQVVSALDSLVEFYADNVGTVDLEIICHLKKLTKLSLAYNYIDFIPDAISLLPLIYFDMSGLPLMGKETSFSVPLLNSFLDKYTVYHRIPAKERTEIFEKIENSSEKLNIPAKITEFNKVLFQKYPRIGSMSKQPDLTIPDSILKITTLVTLILPYHAFVSVPDAISNLTSLETLIVESNPCLESVSPEVANLPIKKLHIRECIYLKTPPKEVVHRGFKAVLGYLKRLLQGFVVCKRTKLMTVGLGGAGKTSLVRALTNRLYNFYEDYAEKITDGIDITEWLVDVSGIELDIDVDRSEPLHFSVWDFAGQTVYYNTHQFFLSNRAVYLLLWNIRLGYEHAGLDFWLSSIACHAPKAPILLVGTHCDKVQKAKLPIEELKRRFPQIVGFYFVSSYTGEGISELQSSIIRSALSQPYMGEKIPEAWLTLEKQLDKLREEKALLKFKEVREAANTVGILDKAELVQAVQFLHDLGSVQFFNTPFLKSHVVIVSQWIVDVMACIVTVHEGPVKDGKFYYSDMKIVWEKYPEELHPWLLRLTEEFDLTFPLSDEEANIVPCLLPSSEPQYDFMPVDRDNSEREAKMIYRFEYLPAGLFNRVQVRLHQFGDSSFMWKTGFLLKKNNHRALLRQTSITEVLVIARGCRPENILFLVHEVFECLISDSYRGVSYDFSVPCAECMEEIDPCMFPASKIKRAFELKIPFLQCDKNFHIISIPEIMASLPPDPNADFDDHLSRSLRELQELDETVAVKVFFIYTCHNVPDLATADKVINPTQILEDMRAAGYNVSYCDDPEKANMESLTLAIKSAQVIVVCISDEFVEVAKCKDLLIYIKQTLHKTLILVAIGMTLAWQKTDINLIIGDEVFVKMTQRERYDSKIKELIEAVKSKRHKKKDNYPECFISYCWANSKIAVDLGSATKEGALGWGDPRKIKQFLQSKGINCWLDIEQMGQEGFFEDIADGLRKAKVMVACVSDEYAVSKNCKMEFRFAVSTLKIPTILAVVGTGYNWERSEIGLLTVGHSQYCPKINLQYENESGLLDLLMEVQKFLPRSSEIQTSDTPEKKNPHSVIAYQEVLELTQRKLLRQITLYSTTMDMEAYPRLILIDIKNKESELSDDPSASSQISDYKKDDLISEPTDDAKNCPVGEIQESVVSKDDNDSEKIKYCFKVLCEHELGWHDMPMEIKFPNKESSEVEDYLKDIAPYMARILAVLKYSTVSLRILTTPQGEQLRKKFEEWSTRMTSEFQMEYSVILQTVMAEDEKRTYGGLKRCHMPNGKVLWLCDKHEKSSFTSTEEKYKSHFKIEPLQGNKYDNENDDEDIGSRPNTVMELEKNTNRETNSNIETHTNTKTNMNQNEGITAVNDKQLGVPEPDEEQKPVKFEQPVGNYALTRRPKLNRRSTGSKKTTSQACLVM